MGGSMLASFSTFGDTTIKQQDWSESGQDADRGNCILKKTLF
jgi:actin-related protein